LDGVHYLHIWDAQALTVLKTIKNATNSPISAISVFPDNERFAVGGYSSRRKTGMAFIIKESGQVEKKEISRVDYQEPVRIYSISEGRELAQLKGAYGEMAYLQTLNDNRHIIGLSKETEINEGNPKGPSGMVYIWDSQTGALLDSMEIPRTYWIFNAKLSPNSQTLAIGHASSIWLYRIDSDKLNKRDK
jgi:WD40 repeat protein